MTVADAVRGTHQARSALHDGQNVAFDAGPNATETPQAQIGIDVRVLSNRLLGAMGGGLLQLRQEPTILCFSDPALPYPYGKQHAAQERCDTNCQRPIHQFAPLPTPTRSGAAGMDMDRDGAARARP
jgi:hypothetical protein